jgi:adenylate kinase
MVERLRRRALRENRFDDANDAVIQRRLEAFEKETRPVLECYPADKIIRIDATMSQIGVLSEILRVLVPIKEAHDELVIPGQQTVTTTPPPATSAGSTAAAVAAAAR